MKKLFIVSALVALVAGCSSNRELIKTMSDNARQDVFHEVGQGEQTMTGYVYLDIKASLKTHEAITYASEDIHGTQDYKLLLNIDGQSVEIRAATRTENSESRYLNDPEVGEGVRYVFAKKVRIKVGAHKVIAAFPADGIAIEREINLLNGQNNTLIVEPIYASGAGMQRPGPPGAANFKQGIRSIRLVVNGQPL